jgi:tetratricopeptide (TPR) repeat protein
MVSAFIVRPFGLKQGVDFDRIEDLLIRPALQQIGVPGGTTAEIVAQGNIREDMFRLLVTADLVIADVSIHNANVFYELGIRHGLRPNATFMLRANIDEFPFDLRTDRYLSYDQANPAARVADLANALKATIDSNRIDSPVYQVLPNLKAPDPAVLRAVPSEYRETVEQAESAGCRGDLRLLAHEARGCDWAGEGLRMVGRAQCNLRAYAGARETWEWLRDWRPDDIEANQKLATIYQRVGDLTRSNQAIQRVIDSPLPSRWNRAEVLALRARNGKTKWRATFRDRAGSDARETALWAPELDEALQGYAEAYAQDLNHYYSGLNALSLLCIRNELAQAMPDFWSGQFDTDELARLELETGVAQFQQLAGAVLLSLKSSEKLLQRQPNPDTDDLLWTRISEADHAFLTGHRPKAVAQRYREALADAPAFVIDAVREQHEVFGQLAIRTDFVAEVQPVLANLGSDQGDGDTRSGAPARVLLFTGHMIDSPGRVPPRFPPTAAAQRRGREMIRQAVQAERELENGQIIGISGGACGGDILFHEVCAELGIETRLFLALPREDFCRESVQDGGPDWVERFNRLCERVTPRILGETRELPKWLRSGAGYGIWQRNNLWMLFNALSLDARSLTLIALWDQGKADGPGGTEDLVFQVQSRGHKLLRLPAEELKALDKD